MKAWSILTLALGMIYATAAPAPVPEAGDLDLSTFEFADGPKLNDVARFERENGISPATPLARRWGEDHCGTSPELLDMTGSKSTEFSQIVNFYCHWITGLKAGTEESYPLEMQWPHTNKGPRMIYLALTNTQPHPITFDHFTCNQAFALLLFGCARRDNGLWVPGGGVMTYGGRQAYLGISPLPL